MIPLQRSMLWRAYVRDFGLVAADVRATFPAPRLNACRITHAYYIQAALFLRAFRHIREANADNAAACAYELARASGMLASAVRALRWSDSIRAGKLARTLAETERAAFTLYAAAAEG